MFAAVIPEPITTGSVVCAAMPDTSSPGLLPVAGGADPVDDQSCRASKNVASSVMLGRGAVGHVGAP